MGFISATDISNAVKGESWEEVAQEHEVITVLKTIESFKVLTIGKLEAIA